MVFSFIKNAFSSANPADVVSIGKTLTSNDSTKGILGKVAGGMGTALGTITSPLPGPLKDIASHTLQLPLKGIPSTFAAGSLADGIGKHVPFVEGITSAVRQTPIPGFGGASVGEFEGMSNAFYKPFYQANVEAGGARNRGYEFGQKLQGTPSNRFTNAVKANPNYAKLTDEVKNQMLSKNYLQ